MNAATFVASAVFVSRIPATAFRSEEPITRGHWADLRAGLGLVFTSRHLLTVLLVWSTAGVATAFVNVSEVVLAKDDLDAGNVGLGFLVSATGVGLLIGSFFAASALGKLGMTRVYAGSIAIMGLGFGLASLSPTIVLVAVLAGFARSGRRPIVYNQVLVQRGSPDAMRGRALAVLMSSYYAVLGLAMAGGGLLVDAAGARVAWAIAGCIYLGAAVLALVLTARIREASVAPAEDEPSGLVRIRSLMNEIDETRRRERAAAEVAVRPREVEGRQSP